MAVMTSSVESPIFKEAAPLSRSNQRNFFFGGGLSVWGSEELLVGGWVGVESGTEMGVDGSVLELELDEDEPPDEPELDPPPPPPL